MTPPIFIFSKSALPILGNLNVHINFQISSSVPIKKSIPGLNWGTIAILRDYILNTSFVRFILNIYFIPK
jgi:hypothetical protein